MKCHFPKIALLTTHRPQNVDHGDFLEKLLIQLNKENLVTIFPCHPRTLKKAQLIINNNEIKNVKIIEPLLYRNGPPHKM